jgi:hypothetical protein
MYGVRLGPRVVETLGEKRLVIFDAQVRDDEEAGENEKNTRDPEGVPGSGWRCIAVHWEALPSETKMLPDGLGWGSKSLAG